MERGGEKRKVMEGDCLVVIFWLRGLVVDRREELIRSAVMRDRRQWKAGVVLMPLAVTGTE